jgi:hypothetical protein
VESFKEGTTSSGKNDCLFVFDMTRAAQKMTRSPIIVLLRLLSLPR